MNGRKRPSSQSLTRIHIVMKSRISALNELAQKSGRTLPEYAFTERRDPRGYSCTCLYGHIVTSCSEYFRRKRDAKEAAAGKMLALFGRDDTGTRRDPVAELEDRARETGATVAYEFEDVTIGYRCECRLTCGDVVRTTTGTHDDDREGARRDAAVEMIDRIDSTYEVQVVGNLENLWYDENYGPALLLKRVKKDGVVAERYV